MKLTKKRLKEIIKEEVRRLFEVSTTSGGTKPLGDIEKAADAVADAEKKTLKIQTDEEGKPLVQEMNILKPLVTAVQKLPIFKSAVASAVEKIPNKGTGNQVLGQIKNIPGVKETELKWIGLDDYLKDKKSVTKQEISEFVDNLTNKQFEKILDFFLTSPKIEHRVLYTASDGIEREVVLSGLSDFFG